MHRSVSIAEHKLPARGRMLGRAANLVAWRCLLTAFPHVRISAPAGVAADRQVAGRNDRHHGDIAIARPLLGSSALGAFPHRRGFS
jgi:hypothetical protein